MSDDAPVGADDPVARARAFAAERVAPAAAEWERARRYPRETIEEAAALGLAGLEVPRAKGGRGLPFSGKAEVGRILAGADFGFAMALLNTHNIAAKVARDVSGEIAGRYLDDLLAGRRIGCTALTEPGAGSDFAAIAMTATRDGAGWRLDGRKSWIINAVAADVILVYAQTAPGSGAKGVASFLVDGRRAGFGREPAKEMTAQHSIGAGGFRLDGYRAEAAEMVLPPGEAFRAAMESINGARVYVAAMCCGMVAACLAAAADHGRRRRTFGAPLVTRQGWRWALGEAEVDLAAADALVAGAARLIDEGQDARHEAAQAKIFATRMAERRIPALAQLMGAEGLSDCWPFSRHMIGARMASFTDGSTEMLLERITAPRMKGVS